MRAAASAQVLAWLSVHRGAIERGSWRSLTARIPTGFWRGSCSTVGVLPRRQW